MHIHDRLSPVNAGNFYGNAQNERAEANRRAAQTRKRLTQAASQSDSAASLNDDETFLMGHWLGHQHIDSLPGDEYHSSQDAREDDVA